MALRRGYEMGINNHNQIYDKLVRDKVPQIIEALGESGHTVSAYILNSNTDYLRALRVKLQEELDEYRDAEQQDGIVELADMVEVIYAILELEGISLQVFEKIRLAKKEERGGFKSRVFLVSVDEIQPPEET
jgi:predicted house-cleaning noncanonical NTP pyrophosphatase (MazG superfamily)